jgi:alginate O-acetyltransferase complex protein AlgI
VYCDFSGYSDMAVGVARILGVRLPDNFAMPCSSVNISEFWRRWHVSLSSWFRDYVFRPLAYRISNAIEAGRVLFADAVT